MKKVRTAVVGCGAISDIYITNMNNKFSTIEVVSCCAAHFENAQKKAAQHGLKATTFEEILEDTSIEMVVILTPAPTHYDLIKRALLAGKHVYTEKVITSTREQAKEVLEIAKEKNLYLGSAPETFLGAGFQTAIKAITDGVIGDVTAFTVSANRNLDYLAGRFSFLRMPQGGIAFDYGVYYLTALISMLGPVDQVSAFVSNLKTQRPNICKESPEYGQTYSYTNESQVTAILKMENGVTGTFSLNGDSNLTDFGEFIIYGTKGTLRLGDADHFGNPVTAVIDNLDWAVPDEEKVLEMVSPLTDNCRGVGTSEIALCIRQGGIPRTQGAMAYHVLDIISQMMESSESGCAQKVSSTCEKPEVFSNWEDIMGIQ